MRPGGDAPHAVWLPPKGSLQESERYIPGGWFWSGGDPEAIEPLPRRRLWIDGFVMSRDPVTNRQYLVFLNDLVANGQTELALRHAPTERAHAGATRGTLVYSRDSDGYFSVGTDADGDPWRLDDPVVQVDEEDAAAYVRWLSARRGRKVRLPSELEWEKAARGVDGRAYPWGNLLDPSWCCVLKSHKGRPRPEHIDRFPVDESPYGIRGLGGNVRDWCAGEFLPNGPLSADAGDLVDVDDPSLESPLVRNGVQRGGAWLTRASSARSASRFMGIPGVRLSSTGFRYCVLFSEAVTQEPESKG